MFDSILSELDQIITESTLFTFMEDNKAIAIEGFIDTAKNIFNKVKDWIKQICHDIAVTFKKFFMTVKVLFSKENKEYMNIVNKASKQCKPISDLNLKIGILLKDQYIWINESLARVASPNKSIEIFTTELSDMEEKENTFNTEYSVLMDFFAELNDTPEKRAIYALCFGKECIKYLQVVLDKINQIKNNFIKLVTDAENKDTSPEIVDYVKCGMRATTTLFNVTSTLLITFTSNFPKDPMDVIDTIK